MRMPQQLCINLHFDVRWWRKDWLASVEQPIYSAGAIEIMCQLFINVHVWTWNTMHVMRGSWAVQSLHKNEEQSFEILRERETKRNVFIKFPATSYCFHLICSCNLLKQLLVFPYLKCEDYLSLITTSLRLPSNTQLKSKHFWWVARAGQYQINAKGKHQEMLPSHPFLQNSLTPSPTCGSQASFSFNLLNFLDTTLHKSYYLLTSAAAHRPIWEADKTESYMAKSKVKTFNSSLILLLDLINRGIYKLIKAGNQDLNV